jgi:hypothetical protein
MKHSRTSAITSTLAILGLLSSSLIGCAAVDESGTASDNLEQVDVAVFTAEVKIELRSLDVLTLEQQCAVSINHAQGYTRGTVERGMGESLTFDSLSSNPAFPNLETSSGDAYYWKLDGKTCTGEFRGRFSSRSPVQGKDTFHFYYKAQYGEPVLGYGKVTVTMTAER